MKPIPGILGELLAQAAATLAPDADLTGLQVQGTQDPTHGDYQTNLAFRLNRVLGKPPRAVAEALVAALPAHPAVASVEVAGPGFVNFRLADDWLAQALEARMAAPDLGVDQEGAGRRIVIDYGSPNVAKRMHVGHLRSTNIGASLADLHRAAGWDVIGDNHLGDWGTHFGKLIVAWRRWADPEAFDADAIGELQRLYERFGQEAEAASALEDEAREETARLQAGDPEDRELWRRFVDASLEEFNDVYRRMGISFEQVLGESFYEPMLQPLVEDLQARGIAEEDQGAVVVRFTEADGKNLPQTPMLIRKRDGAALYATTDLAALGYRERTWDPDRVLYVTDTRQQLHFQQVFAAARRAGLTDAELLHVWFGVLTLPEGSMSSRKGRVIRLRDLLDEAVRRARAVVDEKSPDLSETERAEIAEAVGVAAVRYADLSQNPQSNVVFEWDRMLSLDGNTAPFMMYSFARCRSIQRKADVPVAEVAGVRIEAPEERDLVLALHRFPEAVSTALASLRPNMLCDYLFGLAGALNRFYYALPVLRAEPATRASRLALVEATARVLARGLPMVGIRPLDRM